MTELVLDKWILKKIGGGKIPALTRDIIEEYQLKKINDTLSYAIKNSRFYGEKLRAFNDLTLESLDEVRELPFTTMEELTRHGDEMLCVSGAQISRIVTLHTPGQQGLLRESISLKKIRN